MPRRAKAQSLTIPPPVMGWNTRDALSQMDQTYAVEIENYFPGDGVVALRNGYRQHATGVGDGDYPVYSLAHYANSTTGVDVLVAFGIDNSKAAAEKARVYTIASNGTVTDITGAAALGGATTRLHFFQWRDRLIIGTDYVFSGVYEWTGAGNISLTGLTGPSAQGAMHSYKNRWYGVDQPSYPGAIIYYGGVDAVSGTIGTFNVTSLLRLGGGISLLGSTTRAKDFSEDELFCIISQFGEVLVYGGSYPGGSDWQLVGHYFIPRPLSIHASFYIGSDLCVITSQGVIRMSDVMIGDRIGSSYKSISDAISSEFTAAATTTIYDDIAWKGIEYPRGRYMLVNIPVTAGATSHQYVMNTETGAWTKFTGQNAFSWAVFGDELYFGGLKGKVFKADNGYFDEDPASAGNAQNRTCVLRPAYNYFGDRQSNKQFTSATVILKESEGLSLTVDADIDYADTTPTSTLSDTTDTSYKRYHARVGLTGSGKAASIRFEDTVTTKRRSIEAIDVFWNEGDI